MPLPKAKVDVQCADDIADANAKLDYESLAAELELGDAADDGRRMAAMLQTVRMQEARAARQAMVLARSGWQQWLLSPLSAGGRIGPIDGPRATRKKMIACDPLRMWPRRLSMSLSIGSGGGGRQPPPRSLDSRPCHT